MTRRPWIAMIVGVACMAGSASTTDAQWVYVGRKALGRIRELTQSGPTDGPRFSVATVMISGQVEKVYATALRTIQAAPKARVTKSDPAAGTLEFSDGKQVVGLSVAQISEDVVHLMIASIITPGAPDSTSLVVDATLRVCSEAGVKCSVLPQQ